MTLSTSESSALWDRLATVVDMETHILENQDSIEENLIRTRIQGLRRICATPRFNPYRDILSDFLKWRDSAMDGLERVKKLRDLAQVYPGALVGWCDGILSYASLDRLAIGKSSLVLFDMPDSIWSQRTLESMCLIANRGFTPVVAHVERHLNHVSVPSLDILRREGWLLECGADFFTDRRHLKSRMLFLNNSMVDMVGSAMGECGRAQNLGTALESAAAAGGPGALDSMFAFYDRNFPSEDAF